MVRSTRAMLLLGALVAGCEIAEPPPLHSDNVCDAPTTNATLPAGLEESSGVAASRSHAGVFWTHNDSGGDPVVFAVDSAGTVLGRVRIADATNRDWEDIARGPCEPGSAEDCLFLGEIGDNTGRYANVAVYRIPEPDPATDTVSPPAVIFRFTYPEGPRDAEGLYVTSKGVHVVSKGRTGPVELFRLPPPYSPDSTVTIERVQRLAPPPTSMSAQATAAAVDPEEQHVVIRTYAGLRFFQVDGDTLRPHGRNADGIAAGQLQGEGVDYVDAARLVLTSEAQPAQPATLLITTCDPTRPPPDTAASSS